MKLRFATKYLFIAVFFTAVCFALVAAKVRREKDSYFESCLSSILKAGFATNVGGKTMSLTAKSSLAVVDARRAVEIAVVSERYSITISKCQITREAIDILKIVEDNYGSVHLHECTVIKGDKTQSIQWR
jgi:hypothetical protein